MLKNQCFIFIKSLWSDLSFGTALRHLVCMFVLDCKINSGAEGSCCLFPFFQIGLLQGTKEILSCSLMSWENTDSCASQWSRGVKMATFLGKPLFTVLFISLWFYFSLLLNCLILTHEVSHLCPSSSVPHPARGKWVSSCVLRSCHLG